jgi:DNA-binding response OmpR family regulator
MTQDPYILYIEDEHTTIQLVCEVLRLSGYCVIGKTNGYDGLATMRSRRPELLLLDLMMPGLSGKQVYQEVKRDEALAQIPVIIISAEGPTGNRVIVDDLPPVDDYITKPFDIDRLVNSVRATIANQLVVT